MPGSTHAAQCFEIAGLIAEAACGTHAMPQQHGAYSLIARRGKEVHLTQLTDFEIGARKRRNPGTADNLAFLLDDEVRRARCAVRFRHGGDLRVLQREAGSTRAELRHDARDCLLYT